MVFFKEIVIFLRSKYPFFKNEFFPQYYYRSIHVYEIKINIFFSKCNNSC